MKKPRPQLDHPEFLNDYGSKKDWEEIRRLVSKDGRDVQIETAREVMYFIRGLARLALEAMDSVEPAHH